MAQAIPITATGTTHITDTDTDTDMDTATHIPITGMDTAMGIIRAGDIATGGVLGGGGGLISV